MTGNTFSKNQYGEPSNSVQLAGSSALSAYFKVDPANVNGLGVSSLVTSPGVASVFMHTSATALGGNPNPANGIVLMTFSKALQAFNSFSASVLSPLTGTPINVTTGLTVGGLYVITAVGTTTAAQWQTLGLPTSVTPAVGCQFIAITASAGSGTGVVQAVAAAGSGVTHLEVPAAPAMPMAAGGFIAAQAFNIVSSANALAAPATGSYVYLTMNATFAAGLAI